MGRKPSENRKYQLQSLNDLHHEVLRLSLLGWKPKDIANWLGITEPTVCNVTNGAKGRQQLAILRAVRDGATIDLAKDIAEYAPRAWELYKEALEDPNLQPALRLKYGLEAVGLAGHVKPQRIQQQVAVAHLTSDEISAIKLRARQLAIESGVVDCEYTESDQGRLPDLASSLDENCETRNAGS